MINNTDLETIKKLLNIEIDDEMLIRILFDNNKFFDKDLTNAYKQIQRKTNRKFNSVERKALRNYFYYKNEEMLVLNNLEYFPSIDFNESQQLDVSKNALYRIKHYDSKKILNSIKQKYRNIVSCNSSSVSYRDEWLNYYENKRNKLFSYSIFVLRIDFEDYKLHNYNEQYIYDLIIKTYKQLENYRHMLVVFDGQIFDENGDDITWKLIYKIAIFSENFIQYKDQYFPCKKSKQAKILQTFIDNHFKNNNNHNLGNEFYYTISTGFKYEDCFVEENQNTIILSLKKISRDESPVPCPSCMTFKQSGNSYPEMFLRSFECKNPDCQDRSKSGRGKRFDEYGTYRNFKLEENDPGNKISNDLYIKWRRDIFKSQNNWFEMIIKYYTWSNETVLIYNLKSPHNCFDRKIKDLFSITKYEEIKNYSNTYDKLPLVRLFKYLSKFLSDNTGSQVINSNIEIKLGDSSTEIMKLLPNQIGCAITSPPYYNAREYSQWSNLLLYLIDMMINANSVYQTLNNGGYYLYNIGDIVNEDNVYVNSNMSKRRLPLGFLSCMIFEIVGFNLTENIIWDKGEVQSKRNSTVNLFSGYVKCINCYEHIFVFAKNSKMINHKLVARISPVIKINSKGENTYKHSAPYPLDLVSLIKPYVQKDKYILDPYLGSGTTLKWCKKNGYKGIGYELNKDYFELAKQYVQKEKES